MRRTCASPWEPPRGFEGPALVLCRGGYVELGGNKKAKLVRGTHAFCRAASRVQAHLASESRGATQAPLAPREAAKVASKENKACSARAKVTGKRRLTQRPRPTRHERKCLASALLSQASHDTGAHGANDWQAPSYSAAEPRPAQAQARATGKRRCNGYSLTSLSSLPPRGTPFRLFRPRDPRDPHDLHDLRRARPFPPPRGTPLSGCRS